MGKYSIFANEGDYDNLYKEIKSLESKLKMQFDWKKIKRMGFDELSFFKDLCIRRIHEAGCTVASYPVKASEFYSQAN